MSDNMSSSSLKRNFESLMANEDLDQKSSQSDAGEGSTLDSVYDSKHVSGLVELGEGGYDNLTPFEYNQPLSVEEISYIQEQINNSRFCLSNMGLTIDSNDLLAGSNNLALKFNICNKLAAIAENLRSDKHSRIIAENFLQKADEKLSEIINEFPHELNMYNEEEAEVEAESEANNFKTLMFDWAGKLGYIRTYTDNDLLNAIAIFQSKILEILPCNSLKDGVILLKIVRGILNDNFPDQVIMMLKKAKDIFEEFNDTLGLARCYYELYDAYEQLGNEEKCNKYYVKEYLACVKFNELQKMNEENPEKRRRTGN